MPSKLSPAFFGLTPATKQCLPFAYSRHMAVWNRAVFPVMPCVMTKVCLSTRIDISFPLRRRHDLFGRFRHVVRRDDRQARLRQDLLSLPFVRALRVHRGHGQARAVDEAADVACRSTTMPT